MLRVLLPTLKHVFQQIKVAASCVNTDFWLHKITSLAAKQIVLAWAAQHLQILLQKVELLSTRCNNFSHPAT